MNELETSQQRWLGDEPDHCLTWGVKMSGKPFVDVLAAHVELTPAATIVEIGPGYGRITRALLDAVLPFARYVGVDLSAGRVERLRHLFSDPRMSFKRADILQESLPVQADLVFGSAVFEHFYPDMSAALSNIREMLQPGGHLVFDVIREPDAPLAVTEEGGAYVRHYTHSEVTALLDQNGYYLRGRFPISFGPDSDGNDVLRTVLWARR
jgi:trans-aconitate methyltransferase